ncbi:MAG: NusG domain II-containing protein, partial [Clostridia bacterium]|nr:NusG domain II-containing protein [Clostridia bacterium]
AVTSEPEETAAEQTPQPEAQGQGAAAGPMPPKQAEEVAGYVILTVNGRQYGDPIAMDRDKIITIKQDDGKVNKVHITPDKVYMESSTCENQDCVQQGEITLDNYKTRILSTFVICLPNNVSVEMVPAEE